MFLITVIRIKMKKKNMNLHVIVCLETILIQYILQMRVLHIILLQCSLKNYGVVEFTLTSSD